MENQDFTVTVKVIFQSCRKLIGARNGYVSILDEDGNCSKSVLLDSFHAMLTSHLVIPVTGLCAKVYQERKTIYDNQLQNDSWSALLPEGYPPISNEMVIPLIIEDRVYGLLSLANKPGGFTKHDAEIGANYGKFASIALYSKITNEKITQSKESYRRLVETFPECILLANKEGIIFANRAALTLFGAKHAEELTGRSLSSLIHPDFLCAAQCRLHKVLNGESVSPVEKKVVRLDGSFVDVEVSAAPFISRNRPAVLIIMRDLTQRKLLESQEQMTTKLEAVSILAGGIAHDFNNLLTIILGNLSIAKVYAGRSSAVYEKLREIENAAMQTKDLTRQLLTFAKEDTLVKSAASLEELLREMVPFILHGTDTISELVFADNLPAVDIDTAQFSQVIHNIVINAVQAMPEGGTIKVEVNPVQSFESLCLSLDPGNYIEIKIGDEGCGISQENLDRIFEPFFTTKEQGNGLGLASSYNIMRQHGGFIKVESVVGCGTTFYLYLGLTE
jgi:PAS domain S-box-containing protein